MSFDIYQKNHAGPDHNVITNTEDVQKSLNHLMTQYDLDDLYIEQWSGTERDSTLIRTFSSKEWEDENAT